MIYFTTKNTKKPQRTQSTNFVSFVKTLCVLCGLFFISSCSKKQEEKKSEPGKFFDLVAYFHNEAIALNKAKPEVTKTIIKDGSTETQTFSDSIDWKKELKIFTENGINKPAWKESFSADTLLENGKNTIIYQTADAKIPVKEIKIITDSLWQPTEICIKRNAKNFLYTSEQTLNYVPGKSYGLDSEMHVRWTFDTKFSVDGVFTN
ncbi:MAG: hypothetical protein POELPBGB_01452 [Bacteroidia bacterium]|nr:hypothetical protein [Bacteroidia bacterium]